MKCIKKQVKDCYKEDLLIPLENIDIEKIKTNINLAQEYFEVAQNISKHPNSYYTTIYDSLHFLIDSLVRFEKLKSNNHKCLFLIFCEKYPEFDYNFLDILRKTRNKIHYEAKPITEKEARNISTKSRLYFQLLLKIIKNKL